MSNSIYNTPPNGDFAKYVESLNRLSAAQAWNAASPGEQLRSADLINDDAMLIKDQGANLVPVQKAAPTSNAAQAVAEVFKRRNAEAKRTAVDQLDEIKRSRGKEPFTAPRDAWEARWQPLFELVNQHRWLVMGTVLVIAIAINLLTSLLWQELGIAVFKRGVLFEALELDATEQVGLLVLAGGLAGYMLYRVVYVARLAAAQHEEAPWIFWSLLGGLGAMEYFISNTSSGGFGLLFWLALAFGGVSGGLWCIVRGLHRAGVLADTSTNAK